MAVKKISEIGSNPIRSKAKKLSNIQGVQTKKLIKDLKDTMRHNNLVGIAAPQIGESLRIFVTEIRETKYRKKMKTDSFRVFVNPRIVSHSKRMVSSYEGCGSVASTNIFGPVKRYLSVIIRAQNQRGESFEYKASGFLARVIQHELDHLNGIVFIDKVTNSKQLLGKEEYINIVGGD